VKPAKRINATDVPGSWAQHIRSLSSGVHYYCHRCGAGMTAIQSVVERVSVATGMTLIETDQMASVLSAAA
jgi:hypothetical protein